MRFKILNYNLQKYLKDVFYIFLKLKYFVAKYARDIIYKKQKLYNW